MPKFKAHVSLIDSSGALHTFAPEDDAPEWTKSKVGEHVLDEPFASEGDTAEEDTSDEGEGDGEGDGEQQLDQRPAAANAKPDIKETAAAKAAATPDFTKSTPRRTATKK